MSAAFTAGSFNFARTLCLVGLDEPLGVGADGEHVECLRELIAGVLDVPLDALGVPGHVSSNWFESVRL